MDTTPKNIVMCKKAVEIQNSAGQIYCTVRDTGHKWIIGHYGNFEVVVGAEGRIWVETIPRIWLPRQDEFQEMIKDDRKRISHIWPAFDIFFWIDAHKEYIKISIFGSMEQLWLAFVMKEKYQKIWSENDWISK